MPLNLAYRGGALLRTVRPNVLCRSTRVAAIHTPAKRVSLATTGRLSKLPVGVASSSAILPRILANFYATADEATSSSKGSTGKRKASKGRKKTTLGRKRVKKPKSKPAKKPKKKVLTEKQQAKLAARKRREEISRLKEVALTPPKVRAVVPHSLLISEIFEKARQDPSRTTRMTLHESQEIAKSYSEEEKERFRHMAAENRKANAEAYHNFITSYTPIQIRAANMARRSLTRHTKKRVPSLHDDRLVKKSVAAQSFFYRDQREAGELEGMSQAEVFARVNQAFRDLPDAERQKYLELQAQDRERYEKECLEVYGEKPAPPRVRKSSKAETSDSQ